MAVTLLDGDTSPVTFNGSNSYTYSRTLNAASTMLIVNTWYRGTGRPTGVTWNAVAMTLGGTVEPSGSGREGKVWYLDAPATGTHDLVITVGATDVGQYSLETWSGTTGAPTGFAVAAGSSTAPSVAVTSAAGNLVADYLCNSTNPGAPTAGAGQTPVMAVDAECMGVSYESGAASVTMSWTINSSPWGIIGFSLTASAGATARNLSLLGVGT